MSVENVLGRRRREAGGPGSWQDGDGVNAVCMVPLDELAHVLRLTCHPTLMGRVGSQVGLSLVTVGVGVWVGSPKSTAIGRAACPKSALSMAVTGAAW